MDLEFRFDDAYEFAQRMAKAPEIVTDEMRVGVNRLTFQGEAFTKQRTPVKRGTLRRGITAKPAVVSGTTVTGSWGTNVPYARPVEEGRGPVVASPGKMLRFEIGGTVLYRKRVRAAKGRFMFRDAQARIRPLVAREFAAVTKRIVARMGGA